MDRRDFLTASAVSATIAAAGATAAWRIHEATEFSRERFRAWLHETFQMTAHGALRGSLATLIAVEDGPAQPGLEQFTVVFRGPASLPTGLCWLLHADGAQFSLYLEAAPSAAPGSLRRATFSLVETQDV